MVNRAKTAEEYVDLVKQAIFEVEELRLATEYDMEGMTGAQSFLDELEGQVRQVYNDMAAGTYEFGNEDLPFMRVVEKCDDRLLPFKYLLRQINETHRKGLDVEDA
jgi:hypothetical protein